MASLAGTLSDFVRFIWRSCCGIFISKLSNLKHCYNFLPPASGSRHCVNTTAWNSVDARVHLPEENTFLWWCSLGKDLAILLSHAGYSRFAQIDSLSFFAENIVPRLGPFSTTSSSEGWKSFMTDDGIPVELSWDWGWPGDTPKIRYSVEPIGPKAGSVEDPLNEYAGAELVARLQNSHQGIDMKLLEHFWQRLVSFDPYPNDCVSSPGHASRFFVAFDLHGQCVTTKAYILPVFKALSLRCSTLDLIFKSIAELPENLPNFRTGFQTLEECARTHLLGKQLEFEILSFDCVEPAESRLKVYVRCRETTFDSVKDVVTLGGQLDSDDLKQSLISLRSLWDEFFAINSKDTSDSLPQNDHRTAGVLYNFEIRPNKEVTVPKVYLPVRHYCKSDEIVIAVMQRFMERMDRAQDTDGYRRMLNDLW